MGREKVGGNNCMNRKEQTTANHKLPLATNTHQQQYPEGYTHKTPQTFCVAQWYFTKRATKNNRNVAHVHVATRFTSYYFICCLKKNKSHALFLSVNTDRCQCLAFFVHARRETVVRCGEGGNTYVSSNSLLLHILTTLSSASHAQKLRATGRC